MFVPYTTIAVIITISFVYALSREVISVYQAAQTNLSAGLHCRIGGSNHDTYIYSMDVCIIDYISIDSASHTAHSTIYHKYVQSESRTF